MLVVDLDLTFLVVGMSSVNSLPTFDSSTSDQTLMRQLVVLVFFHFDKNQQYDAILPPTQQLKTMVFLDSVLLVADHTLEHIHPILDSINRVSTRDTLTMDGLTKSHQPTLFPFGSANFWRNGTKRSSIHSILLWYWYNYHLWFSVQRQVAVASSTTSLFDFVGGSEERYIGQTPEGTVLFDTAGTL